MLFQWVQISIVALLVSNVAALNAGKMPYHKASNHTSKAGHKHHGNSTSIAKQCAEIEALTRIVDIANNATKLAHMSAAKAQKIKDEASKAQTQLTALESNSTLANTCSVIDADRKLKAECKTLRKLQKLSDLANNQTFLAEFASKHNISLDKLEAKFANDTAKLQELMSNSTLVSSCQSVQQQNGTSSSTAPSSATASVASVSVNGAVRATAQSAVITVSAMVALAMLLNTL